VTRYEILLGKTPPKQPRQFASHRLNTIPLDAAVLTKFKLEVAKAKRVCTNCQHSIHAKEPCLKAAILDTSRTFRVKGRVFYRSEKIQLCYDCIEFANRFIEKYGIGQKKIRQDMSDLKEKVRKIYFEYHDFQIVG